MSRRSAPTEVPAERVRAPVGPDGSASRWGPGSRAPASGPPEKEGDRVETVLNVLTVLVIVLLWVAAIAFGRDSRQGSDWSSSPGIGERTPHLGD